MSKRARVARVREALERDLLPASESCARKTAPIAPAEIGSSDRVAAGQRQAGEICESAVHVTYPRVPGV